MGRKPKQKTNLQLTTRNAIAIVDSLSRAAKKEQAKRFHEWAGIGGGGGSKWRQERSEKFPLKLHKKILDTLWPKLYQPHRRKPTPAKVTTWEDLVLLRQSRAARGQELWHEDDVIALEKPPDNRRWASKTKATSEAERLSGFKPTNRVCFDDDDAAAIVLDEEMRGFSR